MPACTHARAAARRARAANLPLQVSRGACTHDGTTTCSSMDDAQRSHFREKGWIVVKDVLSADLIAQVLFDPAHSYPVGK